MRAHLAVGPTSCYGVRMVTATGVGASLRRHVCFGSWNFERIMIEEDKLKNKEVGNSGEGENAFLSAVSRYEYAKLARFSAEGAEGSRAHVGGSKSPSDRKWAREKLLSASHRSIEVYLAHKTSCKTSPVVKINGRGQCLQPQHISSAVSCHNSSLLSDLSIG